MTTQEFFDKYNNKGIDYDGYYGFQCVDLADQYAKEVLSKQLPPVAGAKDFWNYDLEGFDKISNTPDGVPQKGDIIIWGTGVGPYGHIAVFDHGDSNAFTSFDQNWPVNSLCHYQSHNYNGVLGWFRPQMGTSSHADTSSQDSPSISLSDQTKYDFGGDIGVQELGAMRSKVNDLTSANHQQAIMLEDLRNRLLLAQNAPRTSVAVALTNFPTADLFNELWHRIFRI